jgi:hypothetical protein
MSDSNQTHGGYFDTQSIIVIVTSTVGLYNALELLLLIFTTFRHFSGLYFWALLVASFGVIPYAIGWLIIYFGLTHPVAGLIIVNYGWVTMITGQSVVLYSRLHLVLKSPKIENAVKWMIIVDAIVFHISTVVVNFGSHLGDNQDTFLKAWSIMEKIQMTAFCIQEFIISGLYVWKTTDLLQTVKKKGTKRVMWQLFTINVIIILMDIALLGLEYRSLQVMEQAFKVVIYSIKLKLEFAILGKLVELVQQNGRSFSNAFSDTHEFVDESKSNSDITRVESSAKKSDTWARPQWLSDFEKKDNVQYVEKVDDRGLEDDETFRVKSIDMTPRNTQIVEDSVVRTPHPLRTRTRTDSDLMYADAIRCISSVSSK